MAWQLSAISNLRPSRLNLTHFPPKVDSSDLKVAGFLAAPRHLMRTPVLQYHKNKLLHNGCRDLYTTTVFILNPLKKYLFINVIFKSICPLWTEINNIKLGHLLDDIFLILKLGFILFFFFHIFKNLVIPLRFKC